MIKDAKDLEKFFKFNFINDLSLSIILSELNYLTSNISIECLEEKDIEKFLSFKDKLDDYLAPNNKKKISSLLNDFIKFSCYYELGVNSIYETVLNYLIFIEEAYLPYDKEVDIYAEDFTAGISNETYIKLITSIRTFLNVEGVILSPWTVDYDYCALRFILDTDKKVDTNRIAFIEKTPRVKLLKNVYTNDSYDFKNWIQGPKGAGGSDGEIPENELYGFYPPSREWCDDVLVLFGFVLT